MQPAEKPQDLYQRLVAFFEDNMLTAGCGFTHHGAQVAADEDLTPSLENTITFLWLQLVHPNNASDFCSFLTRKLCSNAFNI